jgi:2-C-methyl-D-erythritol 4-phosphate cytidylyltransferase
MDNVAIILLSGSGIRFGKPLPKQFIKLKGAPLFSYSLEAFEKNKMVDEIILVVNPAYFDEVKTYLKIHPEKSIKPIKVVSGGETRQQSSYLGISAVEKANCKVLIHDAVRPFISQSIIDDCLLRLDTYQAVSTVIPVTDTLYYKDEVDKIIDIPLRNSYVRAQTPQGFHLDIILKAHQEAIKKGFINAPDDCFLIKKFTDTEVSLISGDIYNIKITYADDIAFAETIIKKFYEN